MSAFSTYPLHQLPADGVENASRSDYKLLTSMEIGVR